MNTYKFQKKYEKINILLCYSILKFGLPKKNNILRVRVLKF